MVVKRYIQASASIPVIERYSERVHPGGEGIVLSGCYHNVVPVRCRSYADFSNLAEYLKDGPSLLRIGFLTFRNIWSCV